MAARAFTSASKREERREGKREGGSKLGPTEPQFCLQVVFRDPAVGNLHPRGLPVPWHPGGGAVLTAARGAQDGAASQLPLRAVRSPSLPQCPDLILCRQLLALAIEQCTVSTHGPSSSPRSPTLTKLPYLSCAGSPLDTPTPSPNPRERTVLTTPPHTHTPTHKLL